MRTAIIGPGRVGTLLAVAGSRAGWRITAVAGGTPAARSAITARVAGVRSLEDPGEAVDGVELVVLAVPDDAIGTLVDRLVRDDVLGPGQRVVHLAGSLGLDVLARAGLVGARTAACHPATTVPAGSVDPDLLVGVPWAVTAAAADLGWAEDLVIRLGGDPHRLPDDARVLYHAGLAVASNAVGAAVVAARRLLLAAQVEAPDAFLAPLARASVEHAAARGAGALTGPVVRGDVRTVARHLERIETDLPELADAYRLLSRAILEPVRPALDELTVAALEELLAGPDDGTGTDGTGTDGTGTDGTGTDATTR